MRLRLAAALLAVALAAVAALVAIFLVRDALADGDPASDYLINQPMFLPFSTSVPTTQAKQLESMLLDAKQKGFPLKVAVIAGPTDLGAIPSLYGKPKQYARFLGQEDYYFFKDELLVVMPQGYGLYKHAHLPAADVAAVARLPKPPSRSGGSLVGAAVEAVRTLAARRGLALAVTSPSGSSSTWRDRAEIVAGVLVIGAIAVVVRVLVRR